MPPFSCHFLTDGCRQVDDAAMPPDIDVSPPACFRPSYGLYAAMLIFLAITPLLFTLLLAMPLCFSPLTSPDIFANTTVYATRASFAML